MGTLTSPHSGKEQDFAAIPFLANRCLKTHGHVKSLEHRWTSPTACVEKTTAACYSIPASGYSSSKAVPEKHKQVPHQQHSSFSSPFPRQRRRTPPKFCRLLRELVPEGIKQLAGSILHRKGESDQKYVAFPSRAVKSRSLAKLLPDQVGCLL